jgi:hypothetical protein
VKFGDKAKSIIASVAPALGAVLGGPGGALAGKMLQSVLGEKEADAIETAVLAGDPATLAKLREAEWAYLLELERVAAGDRDSARKREAAVLDRTPAILAYIVVGSTLLLEGYAFLFGIPAERLDPIIVGRILGTLDTLSAAVVMYYFGSSVGSKAKDAALAALRR